MQQDKRRNIVPREGDVRIVHPTVHAHRRFDLLIWPGSHSNPSYWLRGSVVAPNTSYTARISHSRLVKTKHMSADDQRRPSSRIFLLTGNQIIDDGNSMLACH
jgi:hypothetical protein